MNTKEYFKGLFEKHRVSVEALGWNEKSQEQRFEALTKIGNLTDRKVLDVGCGFGDFYGYLKQRVRILRYVGVDMMPEFVEEAMMRYPEASFCVGDFMSCYHAGSTTFDYVFASGIFSLKRDDWQENVFRVVNKMFDLCGIGIGVNFLSIFGKCENPEAAYVHPSGMMSMLSQITRKMVVDCSYRENDFTVFLYR